MIIEWIRNSLTSLGEMHLDLKKSKFQFSYTDAGIEDHVPLMIYKIFTKINPSTNVEIDVLT